MNNVKGVGYEGVRGNPKEASTRIIEGMEDKDTLVGERDSIDLEMALLNGALGLTKLDAEELQMLELVHYEGLTYDKVAEVMHYSSKTVVHRKLKRIYGKLEYHNPLPF